MSDKAEDKEAINPTGNSRLIKLLHRERELLGKGDSAQRILRDRDEGQVEFHYSNVPPSSSSQSKARDMLSYTDAYLQHNPDNAVIDATSLNAISARLMLMEENISKKCVTYTEINKEIQEQQRRCFASLGVGYLQLWHTQERFLLSSGSIEKKESDLVMFCHRLDDLRVSLNPGRASSMLLRGLQSQSDTNKASEDTEAGVPSLVSVTPDDEEWDDLERCMRSVAVGDHTANQKESTVAATSTGHSDPYFRKHWRNILVAFIVTPRYSQVNAQGVPDTAAHIQTDNASEVSVLLCAELTNEALLSINANRRIVMTNAMRVKQIFTSHLLHRLCGVIRNRRSLILNKMKKDKERLKQSVAEVQHALLSSMIGVSRAVNACTTMVDLERQFVQSVAQSFANEATDDLLQGVWIVSSQPTQDIRVMRLSTQAGVVENTLTLPVSQLLRRLYASDPYTVLVEYTTRQELHSSALYTMVDDVGESQMQSQERLCLVAMYLPSTASSASSPSQTNIRRLDNILEPVGTARGSLVMLAFPATSGEGEDEEALLTNPFLESSVSYVRELGPSVGDVIQRLHKEASQGVRIRVNGVPPRVLAFLNATISNPSTSGSALTALLGAFDTTGGHTISHDVCPALGGYSRSSLLVESASFLLALHNQDYHEKEEESDLVNLYDAAAYVYSRHNNKLEDSLMSFPKSMCDWREDLLASHSILFINTASSSTMEGLDGGGSRAYCINSNGEITHIYNEQSVLQLTSLIVQTRTRALQRQGLSIDNQEGLLEAGMVMLLPMMASASGRQNRALCPLSMLLLEYTSIPVTWRHLVASPFLSSLNQVFTACCKYSQAACQEKAYKSVVDEYGKLVEFVRRSKEKQRLSEYMRKWKHTLYIRQKEREQSNVNVLVTGSTRMLLSCLFSLQGDITPNSNDNSDSVFGRFSAQLEHYVAKVFPLDVVTVRAYLHTNDSNNTANDDDDDNGATCNDDIYGKREAVTVNDASASSYTLRGHICEIVPGSSTTARVLVVKIVRRHRSSISIGSVYSDAEVQTLQHFCRLTSAVYTSLRYSAGHGTPIDSAGWLSSAGPEQSQAYLKAPPLARDGDALVHLLPTLYTLLPRLLHSIHAPDGLERLKLLLPDIAGAIKKLSGANITLMRLHTNSDGDDIHDADRGEVLVSSEETSNVDGSDILDLSTFLGEDVLQEGDGVKQTEQLIFTLRKLQSLLATEKDTPHEGDLLDIGTIKVISKTSANTSHAFSSVHKSATRLIVYILSHSLHLVTLAKQNRMEKIALEASLVEEREVREIRERELAELQVNYNDNQQQKKRLEGLLRFWDQIAVHDSSHSRTTVTNEGELATTVERHLPPVFDCQQVLLLLKRPASTIAIASEENEALSLVDARYEAVLPGGAVASTPNMLVGQYLSVQQVGAIPHFWEHPHLASTRIELSLDSDSRSGAKVVLLLFRDDHASATSSSPSIWSRLMKTMLPSLSSALYTALSNMQSHFKMRQLEHSVDAGQEILVEKQRLERSVLELEVNVREISRHRDLLISDLNIARETNEQQADTYKLAVDDLLIEKEKEAEKSNQAIDLLREKSLIIENDLYVARQESNDLLLRKDKIVSVVNGFSVDQRCHSNRYVSTHDKENNENSNTDDNGTNSAHVRSGAYEWLEDIATERNLVLYSLEQTATGALSGGSGVRGVMTAAGEALRTHQPIEIYSAIYPLHSRSPPQGSTPAEGAKILVIPNRCLQAHAPNKVAVYVFVRPAINKSVGGFGDEEKEVLNLSCNLVSRALVKDTSMGYLATDMSNKLTNGVSTSMVMHDLPSLLFEKERLQSLLDKYNKMVSLCGDIRTQMLQSSPASRSSDTSNGKDLHDDVLRAGSFQELGHLIEKGISHLLERGSEDDCCIEAFAWFLTPHSSSSTSDEHTPTNKRTTNAVSSTASDAVSLLHQIKLGDYSQLYSKLGSFGLGGEVSLAQACLVQGTEQGRGSVHWLPLRTHSLSSTGNASIVALVRVERKYIGQPSGGTSSSHQRVYHDNLVISKDESDILSSYLHLMGAVYDQTSVMSESHEALASASQALSSLSIANRNQKNHSNVLSLHSLAFKRSLQAGIDILAALRSQRVRWGHQVDVARRALLSITNSSDAFIIFPKHAGYYAGLESSLDDAHDEESGELVDYDNRNGDAPSIYSGYYTLLADSPHPLKVYFENGDAEVEALRTRRTLRVPNPQGQGDLWRSWASRRIRLAQRGVDSNALTSTSSSNGNRAEASSLFLPFTLRSGFSAGTSNSSSSSSSSDRARDQGIIVLIRNSTSIYEDVDEDCATYIARMLAYCLEVHSGGPEGLADAKERIALLSKENDLLKNSDRAAAMLLLEQETLQYELTKPVNINYINSTSHTGDDIHGDDAEEQEMHMSSVLSGQSAVHGAARLVFDQVQAERAPYNEFTTLFNYTTSVQPHMPSNHSQGHNAGNTDPLSTNVVKSASGKVEYLVLPLSIIRKHMQSIQQQIQDLSHIHTTSAAERRSQLNRSVLHSLGDVSDSTCTGVNEERVVLAIVEHESFPLTRLVTHTAPPVRSGQTNMTASGQTRQVASTSALSIRFALLLKLLDNEAIWLKRHSRVMTSYTQSSQQALIYDQITNYAEQIQQAHLGSIRYIERLCVPRSLYSGGSKEWLFGMMIENLHRIATALQCPVSMAVVEAETFETQYNNAEARVHTQQPLSDHVAFYRVKRDEASSMKNATADRYTSASDGSVSALVEDPLFFTLSNQRPVLCAYSADSDKYSLHAAIFQATQTLALAASRSNYHDNKRGGGKPVATLHQPTRSYPHGTLLIPFTYNHSRRKEYYVYIIAAPSVLSQNLQQPTDTNVENHNESSNNDNHMGICLHRDLIAIRECRITAVTITNLVSMSYRIMSEIDRFDTYYDKVSLLHRMSLIYTSAKVTWRSTVLSNAFNVWKASSQVLLKQGYHKQLQDTHSQVEQLRGLEGTLQEWVSMYNHVSEVVLSQTAMGSLFDLWSKLCSPFISVLLTQTANQTHAATVDPSITNKDGDVHTLLLLRGCGMCAPVGGAGSPQVNDYYVQGVTSFADIENAHEDWSHVNNMDNTNTHYIHKQGVVQIRALESLGDQVSSRVRELLRTPREGIIRLTRLVPVVGTVHLPPTDNKNISQNAYQQRTVYQQQYLWLVPVIAENRTLSVIRLFFLHPSYVSADTARAVLLDHQRTTSSDVDKNDNGGLDLSTSTSTRDKDVLNSEASLVWLDCLQALRPSEERLKSTVLKFLDISTPFFYASHTLQTSRVQTLLVENQLRSSISNQQISATMQSISSKSTRLLSKILDTVGTFATTISTPGLMAASNKAAYHNSVSGFHGVPLQGPLSTTSPASTLYHLIKPLCEVMSAQVSVLLYEDHYKHTIAQELASLQDMNVPGYDSHVHASSARYTPNDNERYYTLITSEGVDVPPGGNVPAHNVLPGENLGDTLDSTGGPERSGIVRLTRRLQDDRGVVLGVLTIEVRAVEKDNILLYAADTTTGSSMGDASHLAQQSVHAADYANAYTTNESHSPSRIAALSQQDIHAQRHSQAVTIIDSLAVALGGIVSNVYYTCAKERLAHDCEANVNDLLGDVYAANARVESIIHNESKAAGIAKFYYSLADIMNTCLAFVANTPFLLLDDANKVGEKKRLALRQAQQTQREGLGIGLDLHNNHDGNKEGYIGGGSRSRESYGVGPMSYHLHDLEYHYFNMMDRNTDLPFDVQDSNKDSMSLLLEAICTRLPSLVASRCIFSFAEVTTENNHTNDLNYIPANLQGSGANSAAYGHSNNRVANKEKKPSLFEATNAFVRVDKDGNFVMESNEGNDGNVFGRSEMNLKWYRASKILMSQMMQASLAMHPPDVHIDSPPPLPGHTAGVTASEEAEGLGFDPLNAHRAASPPESMDSKGRANLQLNYEGKPFTVYDYDELDGQTREIMENLAKACVNKQSKSTIDLALPSPSSDSTVDLDKVEAEELLERPFGSGTGIRVFSFPLIDTEQSGTKDSNSADSRVIGVMQVLLDIDSVLSDDNKDPTTNTNARDNNALETATADLDELSTVTMQAVRNIFKDTAMRKGVTKQVVALERDVVTLANKATEYQSLVVSNSSRSKLWHAIAALQTGTVHGVSMGYNIVDVLEDDKILALLHEAGISIFFSTTTIASDNNEFMYSDRSAGEISRVEELLTQEDDGSDNAQKNTTTHVVDDVDDNDDDEEADDDEEEEEEEKEFLVVLNLNRKGETVSLEVREKDDPDLLARQYLQGTNTDISKVSENAVNKLSALIRSQRDTALEDFHNRLKEKKEDRERKRKERERRKEEKIRSKQEAIYRQREKEEEEKAATSTANSGADMDATGYIDNVHGDGPKQLAFYMEVIEGDEDSHGSLSNSSHNSSISSQDHQENEDEPHSVDAFTGDPIYRTKLDLPALSLCGNVQIQAPLMYEEAKEILKLILTIIHDSSHTSKEISTVRALTLKQRNIIWHIKHDYVYLYHSLEHKASTHRICPLNIEMGVNKSISMCEYVDGIEWQAFLGSNDTNTVRALQLPSKISTRIAATSKDDTDAGSTTSGHTAGEGIVNTDVILVGAGSLYTSDDLLAPVQSEHVCVSVLVFLDSLLRGGMSNAVNCTSKFNDQQSHYNQRGPRGRSSSEGRGRDRRGSRDRSGSRSRSPARTGINAPNNNDAASDEEQSSEHFYDTSKRDSSVDIGRFHLSVLIVRKDKNDASQAHVYMISPQSYATSASGSSGNKAGVSQQAVRISRGDVVSYDIRHLKRFTAEGEDEVEEHDDDAQSQASQYTAGSNASRFSRYSGYSGYSGSSRFSGYTEYTDTNSRRSTTSGRSSTHDPKGMSKLRAMLKEDGEFQALSCVEQCLHLQGLSHTKIDRNNKHGNTNSDHGNDRDDDHEMAKCTLSDMDLHGVNPTYINSMHRYQPNQHRLAVHCSLLPLDMQMLDKGVFAGNDNDTTVDTTYDHGHKTNMSVETEASNEGTNEGNRYEYYAILRLIHAVPVDIDSWTLEEENDEDGNAMRSDSIGNNGANREEGKKKRIGFSEVTFTDTGKQVTLKGSSTTNPLWKRRSAILINSVLPYMNIALPTVNQLAKYRFSLLSGTVERSLLRVDRDTKARLLERAIRLPKIIQREGVRLAAPVATATSAYKVALLSDGDMNMNDDVRTSAVSASLPSIVSLTQLRPYLLQTIRERCVQALNTIKSFLNASAAAIVLMDFNYEDSSTHLAIRTNVGQKDMLMTEKNETSAAIKSLITYRVVSVGNKAVLDYPSLLPSEDGYFHVMRLSSQEVQETPSLTRNCTTSGKPLVIQDASADPRYKASIDGVVMSNAPYLMLPLSKPILDTKKSGQSKSSTNKSTVSIQGPQSIGALLVVAREGSAAAYTTEELTSAEVLSTFSAISIYNAIDLFSSIDFDSAVIKTREEVAAEKAALEEQLREETTMPMYDGEERDETGDKEVSLATTDFAVNVRRTSPGRGSVSPKREKETTARRTTVTRRGRAVRDRANTTVGRAGGRRAREAARRGVAIPAELKNL